MVDDGEVSVADVPSEGKGRRRGRKERKDSSSRFERALESRGRGPSAGAMRQAARWAGDLAAVALLSAGPALLLSSALGLSILSSLFAVSSLTAVVVRLVPAQSVRRGPGDVLSGCRTVVAVSGRHADAPYALYASALPAATLAAAAVAPAAASLLLVDLGFGLLPGRYRQTLGDRIAGVQAVSSARADGEVS